jgi:hypothetical protein
MSLRMKGATFKTIGEHLGISEVAAYKAVQRGLQILNERMVVDAEALRRETVERLDRLIQVYTPLADKGDCKAGNLLVRCMESKAKLYGLIRHPADPAPPQKPMTDEEVRWEGYRLGLLPKPDSSPPPSSNGTGPTIHGGRF